MELQSASYQQERPQYVLFQDRKRAIIPKVISLVLLSIVFYIGVIVNLSLLNLTAQQETIIKTSSISILFLILILGIYVAAHKSGQPFKFYRDGIQQGKKKIRYKDIINTSQRQDFVDKMFKTYSINLGNNFHLRNIPQEVNITNYLRQLINYSRRY